MAPTRLERGLCERILPDPLDVLLVLVLVVRVPRVLCVLPRQCRGRLAAQARRTSMPSTARPSCLAR